MRRNKSGISQASINLSTLAQKDLNSTTASIAADITSISDTSTSNLVHTQENKIRGLLKELQKLVKTCEDVRLGNQHHIKSITKTHEKLKKETKISQFYRKKLQGLYSKGLEDSQQEINSIRHALDCIREIRTLQSEIHFIKTTAENSSKDKPKTSMRRGVLMSILQQAALTLPLWIGGDIDQTPPQLCGSIPHEDSYICKAGDKVAARVKNQDDEENWILAEVVAYNKDSRTYEVDDIDAEDGQERHRLKNDLIVPLPIWRANPITDTEAIFPKDSIVLALYPQTTCFYRGVVSEPPRTPQEEYLILFEDSSYIEGYSPPLHVPQLYVVAYKDID